MSSLANKLVAAAKKEVGYLEKKSNSQLDHKTANAGYGNYTKYGKWFEGGWSNGQPWCNTFVCWCANEIGILNTLIPRSASCRTTRSWYLNRGRWKARGSYTPKPGDLIIFTNTPKSPAANHIGIVEKVANGRVYTIEGNTGAGSTVIANGGCVAAKNYGLTYSGIYGYCVVDYPDNGAEEEEVYVPKKINVKMNGKPQAVTTIVHEQENYIRMRDLTTLGLAVGYDVGSKTPTVDLAEVQMLKMKVDGKDLKIPNVQLAGINYAGVRAFMEALGYSVEWDAETNTVICMK